MKPPSYSRLKRAAIKAGFKYEDVHPYLEYHGRKICLSLDFEEKADNWCATVHLDKLIVGDIDDKGLDVDAYQSFVINFFFRRAVAIEIGRIYQGLFLSPDLIDNADPDLHIEIEYRNIRTSKHFETFALALQHYFDVVDAQQKLHWRKPGSKHDIHHEVKKLLEKTAEVSVGAPRILVAAK